MNIEDLEDLIKRLEELENRLDYKIDEINKRIDRLEYSVNSRIDDLQDYA